MTKQRSIGVKKGNKWRKETIKIKKKPVDERRSIYYIPKRKKAVEQGHHVWNARKLFCGLALYNPPERYPTIRTKIIHNSSHELHRLTTSQ